MKDNVLSGFLRFIDSSDIREYNKNTDFTPAEWAVLIKASNKRTVEEKLDALQYLVGHYSEDQFGVEKINISPPVYPSYKTDIAFRDIVIKTIEVWESILNSGKEEKDAVYAAKLEEKGFSSDSVWDYSFFSSYEKAYSYLLGEKQHYLEDDKLKEVETHGEICRIMPGRGGRDYYQFNMDMRMVDIIADKGRGLCEDGSLVSLLDISVYKVYVPLPFKKGDIVKVEYPYRLPYYGVISRDWEKPEAKGHISMWVSLDTYDEGRDTFDFTDGTGDCILNYTFCPEEELPEGQKVLVLVSDVRKGRLDYYQLVHKYGRKEVADLLKWRVQ